MNVFVMSRIAAALVLLSPAIFLVLLYTTPGGPLSVVALLSFYYIYLTAVAMFIPLRPAIGERPWLTWLVVCVALGLPAPALRLASGFGQLTASAVGDAAVTFACALVCAAVAVGLALTSRRYDRRGAVELAFPLSGGTFDAVQAGSSRFLNHHAVSRAQRYGVDLVQIQKSGLRFPPPTTPEAFPIYGRPVRSPLEGVVCEAIDGFDDHAALGARDARNPYGNHVILETADGVRVVFAHLKRGTIVVARGQSVRGGDLLGSVGNSGNSTEPHLHIHAERAGLGVPLIFGGRYLVRNSSIHSV